MTANLRGCNCIYWRNPKRAMSYPARTGAENCAGRWQGALCGNERSGARVICFLRLRLGEGVLVMMYAKNVRDNIDPKLLRELRRQYEKIRGV